MKKMMLGRPVGVVDREAAGAADEDWVPKKEALAPLCAPPLGKRASATAADTRRARRIHRHEHKRLIYRGHGERARGRSRLLTRADGHDHGYGGDDAP
jgi:hypothetical protein